MFSRGTLGDKVRRLHRLYKKEANSHCEITQLFLDFLF